MYIYSSPKKACYMCPEFNLTSSFWPFISSPMAAYNSLQDKNLVGYFNNNRMRRHLRKSGLINRRGEIVTESSYRLTMARKEHQGHVRDLMAQAIVHKALDMERHRQASIKRKLEEIAKVKLVQRVRVLYTSRI